MAVTLHPIGERNRRGQRHRPRAEINVTPMVDVMLVLLVVFMITAPLLVTGVKVDLPKAQTKSMNTEQEPLNITVKANGDVYLMDTKIDPRELAPKLKAIAANGVNERIYLRADQGVAYGRVMEVMARVQAGGFVNLALVTDSRTAPKQ